MLILKFWKQRPSFNFFKDFFPFIMACWYGVCLGCALPVFGGMGAVFIVPICNSLLCSFGLNQLAKNVCQFCYLDGWDEPIFTLSGDMIRIVLLTLVIHVMMFCAIYIIKWISNILDYMSDMD